MEERLRKSCDAINQLGTGLKVSITSEFLRLKLDELRLTHEYEEKKYQEREEQRRIREQIRDEEKAQREIEKARQETEEEEARYQKTLEKARAEAAAATGTPGERSGDRQDCSIRCANGVGKHVGSANRGGRRGARVAPRILQPLFTMPVQIMSKCACYPADLKYWDSPRPAPPPGVRFGHNARRRIIRGKSVSQWCLKYVPGTFQARSQGRELSSLPNRNDRAQALKRKMFARLAST